MPAKREVLATVRFSEGGGRHATHYTYSITRFADPPRLQLAEDWGHDYNVFTFSDLDDLRRLLEVHSMKKEQRERAFADLVEQYVAAGGT